MNVNGGTAGAFHRRTWEMRVGRRDAHPDYAET